MLEWPNYWERIILRPMNQEEPDFEPFAGESGRNNLLAIALISGAIWLALGSFILYLSSDDPVLNTFHSSLPMWQELAFGIVGGLVFGVIARAVMRQKAMKNIMEDLPVIKIMRKAKLSFADLISISLVAGITEEWLFRAALQPLLGLWLSAVLFVAIHGYFRFTSLAEVFFGAFMLVLSLGLGLLFEHAGLMAAMFAHATYDLVVMRDLSFVSKGEHAD
jgi:membrane protease YdiL (CAAX protease family)